MSIKVIVFREPCKREALLDPMPLGETVIITDGPTVTVNLVGQYTYDPQFKTRHKWHT